MANIILPQVSILNAIDESATMLVEQNGEINRFNIADLDIGGGDVTINLDSDGDNIDNVNNPIDADTFKGYTLDNFVQHHHLNEYTTKDYVADRILEAELGGDIDLDILAKKEYVNTYTNEQVKKAAPRNLLDNSDWRVKDLIINQRGQNNYNLGAWGGYTIDRWYVHELDTNLSFANNGLQLTGVLAQLCPSGTLTYGKQYTMAVKINGEVYCSSGTLQHTGEWHRVVEYWGENFHFQLTASDYGSYGANIFGTDVIYEWVALYEGEYTLDTLPQYQSKGYENELLVCRQYNPSTGEYIGLRKFGQPHNLLDNSDFRNPVEQAGRNGLHGTKKYAIDRWITESGSNAYGVSGGDLVLVSDKTNWVAGITQHIDTKLFKRNKVYTLAVYGYIPNACRLLVYNGATIFGVKYFTGNTEHDTYYIMTFSIPDTFTENYVRCMISPDTDMTGNTIYLKWAAIYEGEYTAETLPEYQPKGYSAELAECQRYFRRWANMEKAGIAVATSATKATGYIFIDKMRINPTNTFDQLTCGSDARPVTDCKLSIMSTNMVEIAITTSATFDVGTCYTIRPAANGYLQFSAEL